MAKKVMGPGPKKGITTLGAGTGSGITKYAAENEKQKAIKEAARKAAAAAAAAKKPAPKKAAPKKPAAPAPAPKKAAAPAPTPAPAVAAKNPSSKSKRAIMDVDMGKNSKGMRYTMSIDTTNMNKPDPLTYNYTRKDSTGKVVGKGNLGDFNHGIGKWGANQAVKKLAAKAKK